MNHDDFRAVYLAGDVGPEARAHLAGCGACRSLLPDLDATRAMLDEADTWAEPSPQVEELVMAALGHAEAQPERRARWWWLVPAAAVVAAGVLLVTRPAAPDWEVEVPGVPPAADAAMSVRGWNEPAGTRMSLQVSDLPPAPDGFVYEFWMSQGRQHVSAGTFRDGGTVEVWAGVARAEYPRLWVTLEPLDGDESPSRQVVLDTG